MTQEDIILAKNGDEEAIERIFLKFRNYIVKNSRTFYLKNGDMNDLQQEGYIGLLKAIKYYDTTKEFNFDNFAYLCIKRQIITAIKNANSNKNQRLNLAILDNDETCYDGNIYNYEKSFDFYSPEDIVLGKELIKSLYEFLNSNLTKMEKRVFKYLFKENTYSEIAKELSEEPKKIDNCIQRIRKKINVFLQSY